MKNRQQKSSLSKPISSRKNRKNQQLTNYRKSNSTRHVKDFLYPTSIVSQSSHQIPTTIQELHEMPSLRCALNTTSDTSLSVGGSNGCANFGVVSSAMADSAFSSTSNNCNYYSLLSSITSLSTTMVDYGRNENDTLGGIVNEVNVQTASVEELLSDDLRVNNSIGIEDNHQDKFIYF